MVGLKVELFFTQFLIPFQMQRSYLLADGKKPLLSYAGREASVYIELFGLVSQISAGAALLLSRAIHESGWNSSRISIIWQNLRASPRGHHLKKHKLATGKRTRTRETGAQIVQKEKPRDIFS